LEIALYVGQFVTEGAQYLPGGGEASGKRVDKGFMVGPYVETIDRSVSNKYLDDEIGGEEGYDPL
jgi:hypothetical protein